MNDVHEGMAAMFTTIRTLILGAQARAEGQVRGAFAIELIDEKIRQSQDALRVAKGGLVGLMQREQAELRHIEGLLIRVTDLTARAESALAAGNEALALEAAEAIAVMENELTLRRTTAARLEARILRLRQSVETTHRRIIDLKQGAISARAVRQEHVIQRRINTTLAGQSPMAEAEELIAGVMGEDDPFAQSEILTRIDRGLDRADVADRLADAGHGPATKITAATVLARLRNSN